VGKKVHVDSYHRSDGTSVKSYERYDPRAKKFTDREMPEEGQKPSFLSDRMEEEGEDVKETEDKTSKTETEKL